MHPQRRVARMTAAGLAVAAVLIAVGGAQANVALIQVSADPFTNATSQHATELEPDTFANGSTVVAASRSAASSTAAAPTSASCAPGTVARRGVPRASSLG